MFRLSISTNTKTQFFSTYNMKQRLRDKSVSSIDISPVKSPDVIVEQKVYTLGQAIDWLKANGFALTSNGPQGPYQGEICSAMVWEDGTAPVSDIDLALAWEA